MVDANRLEETPLKTRYVVQFTKRGGNMIQGSAFEHLRNEKLDARDFFNTSRDKLPFKQNIFGFALGGPFVKQKHFWFGTDEDYYQQQQITVRGTPTPLLLANVTDEAAFGRLRSVMAAA